jgi:hypothetical protein
MFKKSVGIVAAALAFGVIGVVANGCSSTSTSANPSDAAGGGSDGAKKDGGTTPTDGSTGTGDTACFDPSTVLSFTTAPLAPAANQGKCASAALITQFFTSCITQGDAGTADAADTTCDDFIAANQACSLCVAGFSPPDAGAPPASPWPALLEIDQAGHVIPNVAACLAAISTGTDTCKSNYANDDLCLESGCGACASTDFAACATAETTDPTSTCLTTNPLDAACQAALNGVAQTDADTKCAASTTINTQTDFQNVYTTIASTLCL